LPAHIIAPEVDAADPAVRRDGGDLPNRGGLLEAHVEDQETMHAGQPVGDGFQWPPAFQHALEIGMPPAEQLDVAAVQQIQVGMALLHALDQPAQRLLAGHKLLGGGRSAEPKQQAGQHEQLFHGGAALVKVCPSRCFIAHQDQ